MGQTYEIKEKFTFEAEGGADVFDAESSNHNSKNVSRIENEFENKDHIFSMNDLLWWCAVSALFGFILGALIF